MFDKVLPRKFENENKNSKLIDECKRLDVNATTLLTTRTDCSVGLNQGSTQNTQPIAMKLLTPIKKVVRGPKIFNCASNERSHLFK